MELLGYELQNEDKVHRAIHGTPNRLGLATGGVGENATPEAILAAYDRLGGLILKDGMKVKLGSFYNFKDKKPREIPEVKYIAQIEGRVLEVTEEKARTLKEIKEDLDKVQEEVLTEPALKPKKRKK